MSLVRVSFSLPRALVGGKASEERNVLDELLGEHGDDDELSHELHFVASGECWMKRIRRWTRDAGGCVMRQERKRGEEARKRQERVHQRHPTRTPFPRQTQECSREARTHPWIRFQEQKVRSRCLQPKKGMNPRPHHLRRLWK